MLLADTLGRTIHDGAMTLIDADGTARRFGQPEPGHGFEGIVVRLRDRKLHWKLALNPHLALGEAYMDGTLTIEHGSLYEFLDLLGRNMVHLDRQPMGRIVRGIEDLLHMVHQVNPAGRSRRNVAHHYDLSDRLYDLFLDRDRQYSCAYFIDLDKTIDEAQEAKKRHLAAKLLLRPGQKVLDIGSGWGGLALGLAQAAEVEVTGITLSKEQLEVAERRARAAGLADRVRFHLRDYRHETGRYDRIVSVGMFEHVGKPYYGTFFQKIRDLLADHGLALLHSIGQMGMPSAGSPWLRKYIFPGGYAPALSEVFPAIARAGLRITDVEILRIHYAETLKRWRERFEANRSRVREIYDERFCRMWEFYLAGCEMTFRRRNMMVFQIQLAKSIDAVPITRDYLYKPERAFTHTDGIAAFERPGRTARSRRSGRE
jgi:cyclopropane-fatty-acyl-phospholipid synthase